MEPRDFLEDLKEEIQSDLLRLMDHIFGKGVYTATRNLLCQAVVDRINNKKLLQKNEEFRRAYDNKITSTHVLKNGQVLMVIEDQTTGSVNIAVSVPNMPSVVSYYLCELSEQGVLSYANTGEAFSRLFDDENDHEKGGE